MANSTDEYWDVDGVSLHQYGWAIATFGGTRHGVPALRGDDVTYAYVPGEEWREKIPASRVISLAMWTTGTDPATGLPTTDMRRQWNDNWHYLRKLFWTPRRQFVLTRRWLLTDGEGDPYIHVASALGQYVSGLEPGMTSRTRADFTVDIKLCDPFFYGTEVETTIPLNTPTTIVNPGDYPAAHNHVEVDFVGDLVNPKLTNTTPSPQVWVKYGFANDDNQTVTLNVTAFTATADEGPEFSYPEWPLNRIGYISHSGARPWMGLIQGENSLTLTADSGTGHAVLRFRAPYL